MVIVMDASVEKNSNVPAAPPVHLFSHSLDTLSVRMSIDAIGYDDHQHPYSASFKMDIKLRNSLTQSTPWNVDLQIPEYSSAFWFWRHHLCGCPVALRVLLDFHLEACHLQVPSLERATIGSVFDFLKEEMWVLVWLWMDVLGWPIERSCRHSVDCRHLFWIVCLDGCPWASPEASVFVCGNGMGCEGGMRDTRLSVRISDGVHRCLFPECASARRLLDISSLPAKTDFQTSLNNYPWKQSEKTFWNSWKNGRLNRGGWERFRPNFLW